MMNPLNSYKETTIRTAGQGKLIVMLYDECVRQLGLAEKELSQERKKLDTVHNAIVKAQDIITELNASLDLERGGDIAQNLMHLYLYFNQRLMEANIEKDVKKISEVKEHMASLGQVWVDVTQKFGSVEEPLASSGINIAG